jgi:tetratricopeptide (TPR) repeat protein
LLLTITDQQPTLPQRQGLSGLLSRLWPKGDHVLEEQSSIGNPKSEIEIERALARLLALGLLEQEEDGRLRLHRLLAAFARGLDDDPDATLAAVEAPLLDEANRRNNAGYPAPLLAWQAHLRHLTDSALPRADETAAGLANTLGFHLHMVSDYEGARSYFQQALAIRQKVLGPAHPDTAGSLNNLGFLLQAMGDYEGARPYYEGALAIRQKVLGPAHPDTARSLNNLGALLDTMGDYEGARPYYEGALAINEKVLGPAHPDTA